MDFEQKFDAFADAQREHREEIVQRLTKIETTLCGEQGVTSIIENFGERIASLETHRTYAKGVLGAITILWSAILAWWKFGGPR